MILTSDQRFNVFERSGAAGNTVPDSRFGTVLLSFASKDSRYCRAARFPSDKNIVLACREAEGWKIEAISNLSTGEASNPSAFGSGPKPELATAVETLRTGADLLDEVEVWVAAAKGWRNPVPVDASELDPREILGRSARAYRASKSYMDTGTVSTIYASHVGELSGETRFKTAYVAPSEFRFESSTKDFAKIEVGFIAWRDANDVATWLSSDPDLLQDIGSIQDALDAGAGVSRDSSGMIPGLIFPGSKLGGDIVRLTSPVRLADAQVAGIDCFQVQGFRWPNTGQPTTVWIDKVNYLIRKVYEEADIRGGKMKTTWRYEPAMDVPVEADALIFNRPPLG